MNTGSRLGYLFAISLVGLFLPRAAEAAAPGWKLVKSGDGIRSYSRSVPGSDTLEFKATTVLDARMEVVAQIIRDVPSFTQWMASCSAAKIVKKFDENNMIVHILMDFPMVSDRDLVVKADTAYDTGKGRAVVKLSLVPGADVPVQKGVVRMPEFSGTYLIEYISRERTGLIYTYRANPGGSIPSFIANGFSKNLLFDTLKGLKDMVKKDAYRAAADRSNDKDIIQGLTADREDARAIARARLKERYNDHSSVEELVKSDAVLDRFFIRSDSLAEAVFNAFDSPAQAQQAAARLLRAYLTSVTQKGDLAERLSKDNQLVNQMIYGMRPGEKSVIEILLSRISGA